MKKLLVLNIQMFAGPTLPTNGTHESAVRYVKDIRKVVRKENVVRNLMGRDYEGDPTTGSIQLPLRDTEVTVADYDIVAGVALTTSDTTYLAILVDQDKAINELIDGWEAAAVPDGIRAQRVVSGAFSLARTEELDAILEIETNGTTSANTTQSINTTIYDNVSAEIAVLKKLGITSRLFTVIDVDTETLLLTDVKFTNTASTIGSERVMDGVIGKIRGVEVFVSANLAADVEFTVFSADYAQTGDEWKVMPQINDLKDGLHIGASALQGREAFFSKVSRADGVRVKKFV